MTYKDILVCITDEKNGMSALNFALTMAKEHQAHLTALVLAYDLSSSILLTEGGAPDSLLMKEMDKLKAMTRAQTQRMAEAVKVAAQKAGVTVETRQVQPDYEEAADLLALHARYADVLVMSHQPQAKIAKENFLLTHALFHSGRPVLLVPADWKPMPLRRIVVGWDVGREATRALHEALPVLTRAEKVQLLTAGQGRGNGFGEEPGASMALHLARHGIQIETIHEKTDTEFPEQILARYAKPSHSDLVVMGAYGHSRLREWVLGGVTRHMLQEAAVPLFLAH